MYLNKVIGLNTILRGFGAINNTLKIIEKAIPLKEWHKNQTECR